MIIKPRCDKCGGIDFDIKSTDPAPPTSYAIASEYYKGLGLPQISTLELRYKHYRATCKGCGEEYNYSTPY